MSDDKDGKIIVLDTERKRLLQPHLRPCPTRAVVRDDQVYLVTGEGDNERTLLVMEEETAFDLSRRISRAAADLRERRQTTKDSLAGRALLMWCDSEGEPVFSYRCEATVVERDGRLVRVEPVPETEQYRRYWIPKGLPKIPDNAWFDGQTGQPVEKRLGRRFWRIVATWIPGTEGYARW